MNQEYTTVDRVFAKLSRDLRGTDFHESDVIEWVGEALSFLRYTPKEEECLAFLEVKNHEAPVPAGLQMVLQVARNNDWTKEETSCGCPVNTVKALSQDTACEAEEGEEPVEAYNPTLTDCQGNLIGDYEIAYYRPFHDLQYQYFDWVRSSLCQSQFTPVRLANSTLFNTIVAKERTTKYASSQDEYTIVGTLDKRFRFSFEEGQVAVPYTRTAIDPETGYPLVPDEISTLTAITYYVKWKMAERLAYAGREGFERKADKAEARWLKYISQAKSFNKMPKGIDQYQNLLEQSHRLIPNHRRYYNFFGNLGRPEDRRFFDPDNRDNYLSTAFRGDGIVEPNT